MLLSPGYDAKPQETFSASFAQTGEYPLSRTPLVAPSPSWLELSCCGKYLSFIVIALVRSIVAFSPSSPAPLIRSGDLSPPSACLPAPPPPLALLVAS